ncbi:Scr1 family TA system antitoxin-like transcriptional regulator [Streptomyces sioyaensis]|uniref:helix-turn-helix domain-containing protein n=1 Tax=Streptomyces sioyaensis TaxID=67364 RepID=UPI0037B79A0B
MVFQPHDLSPDRSARDLFGARIRHHREKAGLSLRRLAEELNYSKSHLARIERAESLPYDDLPARLDACFGTDGLFTSLYELARKEPFPRRFRRVIEIASRATVIRQYASATVPGLLQTPELALRSLRCGHPYAPDAEIEAMAAARIDRQTRLSLPKPPRCWFILDEAVLRRRVGSADVMRHQMMSLIERGTSPHVTIQVLPYDAGEHAEMGGSLTLYTLPDEPLLAYLEGSRSGTIVEDRDEVMELEESYDLLKAMALSPRDSEAMIRAATEDWTPCEPPRT